ncbi:hypothetical protein, partial [Xanthomonas citri]
LAPRLLALAQALSVTERQLHGSLLNMRRVVSRICGALFRASLDIVPQAQINLHTALRNLCDAWIVLESCHKLI